MNDSLNDSGMTALKAERTARKQADRDLKEMRSKYFAARDKAELWEYRAKRYSETLKTLRIKLSTTNHK